LLPNERLEGSVKDAFVDLPQYKRDHQDLVAEVDGFDPSVCCADKVTVIELDARLVDRSAAYVIDALSAVGLASDKRVADANPVCAIPALFGVQFASGRLDAHVAVTVPFPPVCPNS
jgi:hypothetical protein